MTHYFTKSVSWLLATLLVVSVLMSGCGQKGALYLPEEDQEEEQQNQDSG
jgi:predicted small lipoprotein YifL